MALLNFISHRAMSAQPSFGAAIRDMLRFPPTQKPNIQPVADMFALAGQEVNAVGIKDVQLHDKVKYRSVTFSDIHLGTSSACAADLVAFLEHFDAEFIFLLGDMVDGWKMKGLDLLQIMRQDSAQKTVLQKLLKKSRHGVKIVYVPGNHDEHFRDFVSYVPADNFAMSFNLTHDTANGERILGIHGDSCDEIVRGYRWLSILGTHGLEVLSSLSIQIDRWRADNRVNTALRLMGLDEGWSLARTIRERSDGFQYSESFKTATLATLFTENAKICAWNRSHPQQYIQPFNYIETGHTHIPFRLKIPSPRDASGEPIGPESVTILNTGCWVGRPSDEKINVGDGWREKLAHPICTAIVEHVDGRLEHVAWIPNVGIVPLEANADGTFKNPSMDDARKRMDMLVATGTVTRHHKEFA